MKPSTSKLIREMVFVALFAGSTALLVRLTGNALGLPRWTQALCVAIIVGLGLYVCNRLRERYARRRLANVINRSIVVVSKPPTRKAGATDPHPRSRNSEDDPTEKEH